MAALRGVSSDRWEIARFAGNDDKREPENDVNRNAEGIGVEHRLVFHGKG